MLIGRCLSLYPIMWAGGECVCCVCVYHNGAEGMANWYAEPNVHSKYSADAFIEPGTQIL